MTSTRTLQQSFSGGEVTPEFYGRFEDGKYQSGLAICRNFVVKPHGPIENRAGFGFVRAVKDGSYPVPLVPFTYSSTQTMIIEMGAGYFRFHTQGQTLVDASGNPYEVANPYAAADLFDIHYVQSADVLTLVHPNYPPKELRRLGALNWTLVDISFTPALNPPVSVSLALAQNGFGTAYQYNYQYQYVVTAISADGLSESAASSPVSALYNLYATGGQITISWAAVSGASAYNVYKYVGGIYGYIGQTSSLQLIDDNITANTGKTPPIYDAGFVRNGIVSVPVTSGGSGYASVATGGVIQSVTVQAGGSGYATPTVTVSDPTGTGASFTATVVSGVITAINIVSGGVGYTSPTFIISASAGSGAKLSAAVSAAVFVPPTLTVSDSTGSGAVLRAIVTSGAISGVMVINPGKGYTAPSVSVTSGGGSGAAFGTAVLSGTDYPGAVSYFEQRRCFAGSSAKPQNLVMTRSGTESNLSYSLPSKSDDRIAFRVAAREANTIRHIVPLTNLILLTGSAEWRVTSLNSDAITPDTISVRPQSYIGANNVQPVIINNNLVYATSRGGHMRELSYSWQANGYMTNDISLRAPHLFDDYDVVSIAYSKAPLPVVWCVSSSGKLLGFTYVPEQQVGAWHQHDTDGAFESCAVVAEGSEDALYVTVRRVVNGAVVRYVERMQSRKISDIKDSFFVDAGLTYEGPVVSTLSGLGHLETKAVSVLINGMVYPTTQVVDGKINIDTTDIIGPMKVVVGLPITADIQTLPVGVQVPGYGQGRPKNINKIWARLYQSSGFNAGPTFDNLTEFKQRTTEAYGTPPDLMTDEMPLLLPNNWGTSGQVCIRQTAPLPFTLVGLTTEVAISS